MRVYVLFLSLTFLYACQGSEDCPLNVDVSDIKAEVEIIRLEQEIFQLKSKAEIEEFLKKYPDFARQYMLTDQLPSDTIAIDQIYTMIQEPHQDTLYQDVEAKYKDLSDLEAEFEQAFKHIKYYYPDFKIPKIYTVTTGLHSFFGRDLYVSDDLVVVSLDYFMGEDARYRPPTEEMPQYIWRRYGAHFIVPYYLLQLSQRYNQTDFKDQSLLAGMIAYGKAYYFMESMIPCLADSIVTGYTDQDIRNLDDPKNREYLWTFMIDKQVLFSTKQSDKRDYIGDAPYMAVIGKDVPGAIGRWFGWRIVQTYMQKHPEMTLPELMQKEQAQEIFNQSGYKGG